ncbi:thermonuclease family protein [Vineibacter terrae]|uniref:Thermonuclease family protein n=1 Tax=Vineibacter terrae TaxID=2586908 RepID=A0A5C8PEU7_9HYPH|nr:thermonuclease family protein [Vineibacter terrae]
MWLGIADAREGRQLVGTVTHVRDGDTIVVNGVPVRLNGLHAPELREPGGPAARAWMIEHTRGEQVVCQLNGDRTHDRWVGVCRNQDGDLAAQLIAAGLGRDCPRWSGGRYGRLEKPVAAAMTLPAYCLRR